MLGASGVRFDRLREFGKETFRVWSWGRKGLQGIRGWGLGGCKAGSQL